MWPHTWSPRGEGGQCTPFAGMPVPWLAVDRCRMFKHSLTVQQVAAVSCAKACMQALYTWICAVSGDYACRPARLCFAGCCA
jgi:hypothetical protein